MTVTLATLGECRATTDTGATLNCPNYAVVVMAYLYDIGHPVSRKGIAAMLWPMAAPDVQLTNLRSLLRRTFMAFEPAAISPLVAGTSTIELDRQALRVDFEVGEETELFANRLKRLIGATSSGFLRGHVEHSDALRTWSRAVESRLEEHLHQVVLQFSNDGNPQNIALIREASVYLKPRLAKIAAPATIGLPSFAEPRQGSPWSTSLSQSVLVEHAKPISAIPRVALLPPLFAKGADPILFRVACGLVEDVTIDLCRERTFAVVSPYTSDKLRHEANKAEFLQRHNVAYALDTRLSAKTLLVQLVFYPADEVIWAARLSLDGDHIVSGRQSLLSNICENVAGHVLRSRAKHDHYLVHADAYRSFLFGSQQMRKLSLPAVRKARKHFKSALLDTPRFALALSSLARTLYVEWLLTARGDPNLLSEADQLARQAIEADPLQSSGYRELGMTQIYLGDLDHSVAALAHAEYLSPHHADGLYSFGDTLVHASRPAEALVKLGSAIDHSPIAPDSYLWSAAGANYFLGRYSEAITLVNRMDDPSPADRIAAAAYAMAGDMRQARIRMRRVMETNPSFDVSKWLGMVPCKDPSQLDHYREGLLRAGF